jgi:hypothetical protein
VVFEFGPWFWGRASLFLTPWFSDFNPNKLSVTKTPIWIQLLDLTLHLWGVHTLEAIGNSLGNFKKLTWTEQGQD